MKRIHYFGGPMYDSFHHEWFYFQAACGITLERARRGSRMKNLTNKFERVTCNNCIKLFMHFRRER